MIIKRLGYDTVKVCLKDPPLLIACRKLTHSAQTNLYTVAPNVSGAVMLLILAFASDFTRLRFPYIALGFLLTFIGFLIYVSIDVTAQLHVAYFACFMMTWGTSAPSVILDVWYNNNIADENRRVMLTSIGVPVANLSRLSRSFKRRISNSWRWLSLCQSMLLAVYLQETQRSIFLRRRCPPAALTRVAPAISDTC